MGRNWTISKRLEYCNTSIMEFKKHLRGRTCIINSSVADWEYMEDFLIALCYVDKGYYMYPIENSDKPEDKIYPERVFAYEFYHQFRKRMEKNEACYYGKYLNGEQTKNRHVEQYIGDYTPDLILHKKLDGLSPQNQLWLCEIKMMGNNNPLSDIEKFKKMKDLNFHDYIFLYAGSCLENFQIKIYNKERKGKISREEDGNRICICSFYDNNKLFIECHRLRTLLDMIDKIGINAIKRKLKEKNR